MHDIVRNTCENRLVNIIGLPGIGKTSLTKNVVHYIADRKIFKAGIIFLHSKGYMNCEIFLKKLFINFVYDNFELDKDELKDIESANAEGLLKMCIYFLKNIDENILIVFDNVEDLLYYDKKAIRNLINDLLVKCPLIHILLTSRTTLGVM